MCWALVAETRHCYAIAAAVAAAAGALMVQVASGTAKNQLATVYGTFDARRGKMKTQTNWLTDLLTLSGLDWAELKLNCVQMCACVQVHLYMWLPRTGAAAALMSVCSSCRSRNGKHGGQFAIAAADTICPFVHWTSGRLRERGRVSQFSGELRQQKGTLVKRTLSTITSI